MPRRQRPEIISVDLSSIEEIHERDEPFLQRPTYAQPKIGIGKIAESWQGESRLCPDCHGTALSPYPDDGGSCPHCFGGYVK